MSKYTDWLSRQSKEFQDSILSEEYAEEFRYGKVTTEKFLDKRFVNCTLEQLKQFDELALKDAGLE